MPCEVLRGPDPSLRWDPRGDGWWQPARLKIAREARGLTREDLAERLGVTAGDVSAWETDQRPPETALGRLELLLEVARAWYFKGQSPGSEPTVTFICSRGRRSKPKPCACGAPSAFLCDGPKGAKGGKTCDAPLCARCRVRTGPHTDLCPACAGREPPPQRSLPGIG